MVAFSGPLAHPSVAAGGWSVRVPGANAISVAITGLIAEIVPVNVIYAAAAFLAAGTGAAGWLIKEFRELE